MKMRIVRSEKVDIKSTEKQPDGRTVEVTKFQAMSCPKMVEMKGRIDEEMVNLKKILASDRPIRGRSNNPPVSH